MEVVEGETGLIGIETLRIPANTTVSTRWIVGYLVPGIYRMHGGMEGSLVMGTGWDAVMCWQGLRECSIRSYNERKKPSLLVSTDDTCHV